MSKKKDLKKQLKGPDAFQTSVVTGMDRAMEYKGFIITAVAAVVIGTIGLAGYEHLQKKQKKERVNELGVIEEAYEEETEAVAEERNKVREQIGKLTAPGEDGKPPKLTPAQEKKREELTKQVTLMQPDHSDSLKDYKEFFTNHKGTPEGWMAGARAAGILVDQKNYEEAAGILSDILQTSDSSFFYQINGRVLYINVLSELKQHEKALAEVDILEKKLETIDREAKEANAARKEANKAELKNPAEDLVPQILLTKGRLLIEKGDKEAAGKVFDEIMEKHEESNEARQALSYKALML